MLSIKGYVFQIIDLTFLFLFISLIMKASKTLPQKSQHFMQLTISNRKTKLYSAMEILSLILMYYWAIRKTNGTIVEI